MACVALFASRRGRISAALLPRCAAGLPPAAVGLGFAAWKGVFTHEDAFELFAPVQPKGNPVVTFRIWFF